MCNGHLGVLPEVQLKRFVLPRCMTVGVQVLRMLAQFEILDESDGRTYAPSTATKLLVRVEGEEATLGHFVVSAHIPKLWRC
jgi:hypothetical protein